MKKIITVALTGLISLSAMARDVIPKNGLTQGSPYVSVTKINKDKVRFEKCISGYEAATCTTLGKRNSYRILELEAQESIENCQVAGAVTGDVAIITGLVLGGLYAGLAVGATAAGADVLVGVTTGGLIGAAGAAGTLMVVQSLNPMEQNRQANTISNEVITDSTVRVDDIGAFIDRLELVLSKI